MSGSPSRLAGLLVPLWSMPSSASWGIGEIGDLPVLASWLDRAGFRLLQLLPINEMAAGQTSPYSAISGMAIDPIYISLRDVRDFTAMGGESRLDLADQIALRAARETPRVDYAAVRRVKEHALRLAFSYFWDVEWVRGTARAGSFAAFCSWEEWWLADYALYRALRDRAGNRSWTDWDEPLRTRDAGALEQAREELATELLFHQYLQWLADDQWQDARERSRPVALFGDFPFMVAADSADVWAHQHLFRFDATVGVPPDAFSASGQDWGLPVYRWDVMEREDHAWLRQRVRRSARLFDGYRIDHLVGFYRTYSRGLAGDREGQFDPAAEADQLSQGERLMEIFKAGGSRIIAEDLGVVPEFVRTSLNRMEIPGYRVFRWERHWDAPGQPFRDPAEYPTLSVATTGTHDTETLKTWWREAGADERRAFLALPQFEAWRAEDVESVAWSDALRDRVLEVLYRAPSDLLVLPIQDIFGWEDRINIPATVSDENWTWRLPWRVDALSAGAVCQERVPQLRRLAGESGRLP